MESASDSGVRVLEAVEEMGGILSLLLVLCMVVSGSFLCMVFSGSVLGRQQERDSVARRVRAAWPLVFFQEPLWVDDDAQPTDIPRREWKGKSSVAEVNSRCTKQQEEGTVKARPPKGISFSKGEWQQFPNAPPIFPFNASDERQSGAANQLDPVHLASFSLTNFQGEEGRRRATYYWKSQPQTTSNTTDSMGSITFQMTKHFKTDSIASITFQMTKHFKAKEATRLSRLTSKA